MFDIVKPEYANKTFRMPIEFIRELEAVAQNNNVSVNNLVIQCCEYALKNRADAEPEKDV
jgi:predicted HicB family RNase H-like nuclease